MMRYMSCDNLLSHYSNIIETIMPGIYKMYPSSKQKQRRKPRKTRKTGGTFWSRLSRSLSRKRKPQKSCIHEASSTLTDQSSPKRVSFDPSLPADREHVKLVSKRSNRRNWSSDCTLTGRCLTECKYVVWASISLRYRLSFSRTSMRASKCERAGLMYLRRIASTLSSNWRCCILTTVILIYQFQLL